MTGGNGLVSGWRVGLPQVRETALPYQFFSILADVGIDEISNRLADAWQCGGAKNAWQLPFLSEAPNTLGGVAFRHRHSTRPTTI